MADKRKIKGWITRGGKHIPIYEGDMALKNGRQIAQKYRKENTESKKDQNKREFNEEFKKSFKEGLKQGKDEREQKKQEREENRKKEAAKKRLSDSINKDQDTKDKQIAANKKKADELNGKKKSTGGHSGSFGGHKSKTGNGTTAEGRAATRAAIRGAGSLATGELEALSRQGSAATKRNQSKGKNDKDKTSKYDEFNKKKKGRK